MRYLFVSHIFPPAIDGGSRVLYKMGQYFIKEGNQVLYVSSDCFSSDDFVNPLSKKIINLADANHIYIPVNKYLKKPLKIFSFLKIIKLFRKGPIFKIFPLYKALKKIIEYRPEIIICGPLPNTICFYCHLLKKYFLPNTKLIINASFHENDIDFYNKHLIKSLNDADLIWSLTQHETDIYLNKFNINKNKIVTIGNGVDKSLLINKQANYKNKNILYIGSFSKHKNIDVLISAFNKVNKIFPDSTLTIAGQNTLYSSKITDDIKNKQIKIINSPSDKKIISLIDNCLVLVQPSLQESFGLTLIEANARKKPIITSDIPTLSEINKKLKSGFIFKNQTELKNYLLKFLSNSKLSQNLGQKGYINIVTNFTWDIIGNKLKSAILKL